MLTKEEIEICAENFGHEYFFHYDLGDWKQIKDYAEDIPKIIRTLVKMDGLLFHFGSFDKNELFREIMEDINNIK
jgi:hypothetical protein